ncbi:hypothetical protein [Bacillus thuringiensis]|uniref:hypothetical protein n=1 Tax=Bacillus thuringiensis TaxID=1428 RepID=UPI0021CAE951|nr:hypothetical protein [Bacillus thuringiensis]MCU4173434.1 hypothetical protein [Bacillus thuringiensis]
MVFVALWLYGGDILRQESLAVLTATIVPTTPTCTTSRMRGLISLSSFSFTQVGD